MRMIYKMRLQNIPYEKIKNGTKTIELRVNDEKRKLLKVGDTIEFENRSNLEKQKVVVEELEVYPDFSELYKHYSKEEMGYLANERANPKDMEEFYSKEEQERCGVVAIRIKK